MFHVQNFAQHVHIVFLYDFRHGGFRKTFN